MTGGPAYNERLFSKGVRSRFHHARFYWLREQIARSFNRPISVLELGCFDAKTIHFMPTPPSRYHGYDANWENGLDLARKAFDNPVYEFHECDTPQAFNPSGETFDLVICMETLEHLPDEDLEDYLEKLSRASRGKMLISVPNEVGLVFLGKFLVKLLIYREKMNPSYRFMEVVHQTLGLMDRVVHDDHKGFDYRKLHQTLSREWDVRLSAIPFGMLPHSLGFSIGMVCVRKKTSSIV